ncbi:MAG: RDD family protein [Acidimicrobiales bacterium]|nr:RDD family protein [Acidimicrobiales bacterium]MYD82794.1 RDD family protein [Acidimicrobiales bacterium]MYJ64774.1 RDD family protein [Acidimicrobiales bacterium]
MTDSDGPWQRADLSAGSRHRVARLSDGSEVPIASAGERLAARVADFGISVCFLLLIGGRWLWSLAIWTDDNSSGVIREWRIIWLPLLPLALFAIYRIVATALWGQTLGKRALSIRVVDASSGRRLRWHQSLGRTAMTAVGGFVSLAGLSFWFVLSIVGAGVGAAVFFLIAGLVSANLCYLSITWHAQRQGWHDRAAKTLVVRLP